MTHLSRGLAIVSAAVDNTQTSFVDHVGWTFEGGSSDLMTASAEHSGEDGVHLTAAGAAAWAEAGTRAIDA